MIANPCIKDDLGNLVTDTYSQVKLRYGDEEIRFEQDPFPLYPGEKLFGKVSPLQVIQPNAALKLRAIRDLEDHDKHGKTIPRVAGDEWLYEGPGTYLPRVEVQVFEHVRAIVVKPGTALKLRARKKTLDRQSIVRKAGEEWLVRQLGAYLPGIDEEVVETVSAYVLTDKKALHLRASRTFTDVRGKVHKAGEEWLVTSDICEAHIPDVFEQVLGEVKIVTLSKRQYAVILDPIGANGLPVLGSKQLRKGEQSFFLNPGERLESGVQNVYILGEEEALLLRAKETFKDGDIIHKPGDRWMVYGPSDFIPPCEVEVAEKRKAIPLDQNEGIYVRDIRTGKVRAVIGKSYMLKPNEELWEKELQPTVEKLLAKDARVTSDTQENIQLPPRDKTRVVTYRCPHNSAVQVYDYKDKKSRVVFGPELVMLGPDEHFTVLSLSGDKPKRPHVIKALGLLLGPDFMTDIVIVETSDHARLSLKLSYNWQFDIARGTDDEIKIFQVPDFVGDSCKAIAARVRGSVASVSFDYFHKNSAQIIKESVFAGNAKNFMFKANNLVITNIDIQSVEPVDQHTRDSLQKSVQLAIEITTKSQEAAARHEAERLEQEARGRLERQKIMDEAEAEKANKTLLVLQAECAEVESSGHATAEARAKSESEMIGAKASVDQAKIKAESMKIRNEANIDQERLRHNAEIQHKRQLQELEVKKKKELAKIESEKFKNIVRSIGSDTISAIAQAGPEMKMKLLQGLGLSSVMITDGNSPINLFNTAQGLIGGNDDTL